MANYAISNVPRRVVYSPSGVGPYAFTFEILAASDIAVYKGDTLLTLTTDYTVTINANGTGSVTLVATAGTSNITIVGSKTIARTTDFTTGGDFFANTLNDELDAQTIYVQQVAETAERGLKAPVTDPTDINMTLPRKTDRANKYLAFDANGNPQPGDTAVEVGQVAAIADEIAIVVANVADIQTVADNIVDVQNAEQNAIDAAASAALANDWATKTSSTVAGGEYSAKYHAQAAASSASSADGSAIAAAASAASAASAYDAFDDRYLGSKTSDPTLDNDGNALVVGALYYRTTAPVGMKVYDGANWIPASSASVAALITYEYVATAGQTTFSGADANSVSLAYTVNSIIVAQNGVILRPGDDYTATNGTSVVLTSAASLSDEIVIHALNNFTVADAYTKAEGDARYVKNSEIGTTVQAYDANTAKLNVVQSFTKAQRGTAVSLTSSSASIASDFSLGNNFTHTFTENTTLANPSNLVAGQSGVIVFTQHASSPKTLAYGSYWKFSNGTVPSVTASNSAVDVLAYYVESSTRITARLITDVK